MISCLSVEVFRVSTPIGDMVMKICVRGLHSLNQINDISDENFKPNRNVKVILLDPESKNEDIRKHSHECVEWLKTYFQDVHPSILMSLPSICITSGVDTFSKRVWVSLAKNIGPGQTISYGQLAKLAGSPGASQAAGQAMATNPIQIMVPCHRVIRSDGSMGLYSRGCKNKVKAWLLDHEGVSLEKLKERKQ